MAHWHDFNPWADRLIYIPSLEELAECCANIGGPVALPDGSVITKTVANTVAQWQQHGKKLDAYVLPQPSGNHDMGIRYGKEGKDYISPYGDPEQLEALIKKYGPRSPLGERWSLDLDAWPGQAAIRAEDGSNVCYVILSDEVGETHPAGRLFRRVARPLAAQRAKLISKAPELKTLLAKYVENYDVYDDSELPLYEQARALLDSLA